jgi:cytoskeletal protein CcmA (bactofilin family)
MGGVVQSGIGKSVVIKGEVTATEPLVIGGRVEGQVDVRNNMVTILESGEVHAEILGKSVIIHGKVVGSVDASERLEVSEHSSIEGDLSAPRIAIAAGAVFNGTVEMPERIPRNGFTTTPTNEDRRGHDRVTFAY